MAAGGYEEPRWWDTAAAQAWWRGEGTAAVTCFSFYANKTITTGEGGMATTGDADLAERMRLMSLHGLSKDAWNRYSGGRSWDYRIVAPGYKYNMTDVAAAIGIHQLRRTKIASTHGTSFRFACGSTGSPSIATPSSTS